MVFEVLLLGVKASVVVVCMSIKDSVNALTDYERDEDAAINVDLTCLLLQESAVQHDQSAVEHPRVAASDIRPR